MQYQYGFKSNGKPYHTSDEHRLCAKLRRIELQKQQRCINGAHHGPPVDGHVRCEHCLAIQRGNDCPACKDGTCVVKFRGWRTP